MAIPEVAGEKQFNDGGSVVEKEPAAVAVSIVGYRR